MSSESPLGAAAPQLAEWGLRFDPQINYDLDKMFPKLTGWGAKGQVKEKHKVIANVEPLLRRLLRQGEQVLYVAKGVQTKFVEQYFMGVWAMLINQTVFVLTNARLLMLHTDTKGRPRHTFWLIYYSQIDQFKGGWTGQMTLKLKDGLKLIFSGFRGVDRKEIPQIFEQALAVYQQRDFNPQVTQSRENLCSNCLKVVPKDQYSCSSCGQQFWRPSEVAMRSLVFPSWGDFLMGHTGFAIVELLGYTVTWFFFLGSLVVALGRNDPEAIVLPIIVFIFLAFQHCIDAGLTYFIAKKGLTPKGHSTQMSAVPPPT